MRVRLPRVDQADLNLFEFDMDLTMMVFFLDANDRIYARYGGRDVEGPDSRQSLEGLRQTMTSVLNTHKNEQDRFAKRQPGGPFFLHQLGLNAKGCMHCHQIKEELNRRIVARDEWDRDQVWRYPLPENIGIRLALNNPDLVETVTKGSAADKAGLKIGDRLRQIDDIPIHGFADAQTALDRAPRKGMITILYRRSGKDEKATLELADGWRKGDLTWRISMRRLVPRFSLPGKDLAPEEKTGLGLDPKLLAFRLAVNLSPRLLDQGFEPKEVVVGIEGKTLDFEAADLAGFVERDYLVGETVRVRVNRMGRSVIVPVPLAN